MLVPAILYKEELEKAFAKEIYSDKYFYYMGYAHGHELPKIEIQDYIYQYAIINGNQELLGYLAYSVNTVNDCAFNFGLYSFDTEDKDIADKLVIGKDLYDKLQSLIQQYHRLEWRMVDGNPVKKHYDEFCEKYYGNRVVLHDVCKDNYGFYHDEYIYEIISNEILKSLI